MTVPNTKLVALPYDIIVDIISRLPLKLIFGCKILSKTINYLISSGPSFSQIYLTNQSNSSCTIKLGASENDYSLILDEFDQKGDHKTVQILNTGRLPGSSCKFSISGYWNGLICLSKLESGLYKCIVMNPISGEFIQLPEQVDCYKGKILMVSYGLGKCQLSNRYKVLSVISLFHDGKTCCRANSEIFTIGYDQIWRSVSDVIVPDNIEWWNRDADPQPLMVPLRSALHWIVYPKTISLSNTHQPGKRNRMNICAFDMTEEKVSALQVPPEAMEFPPHVLRCLNLLLDKLCLLLFEYFHHARIWVMDEYGDEGSWTKKLVLQMDTLPCDNRLLTVMPSTVSPGGVILIGVMHKMLFYDLKTEIIYWRKIDQPCHYSHPILFVPNFSSLRNLIQPSGSMTDVPPCSLVASAPLDDQLR